MPLTQEDFSILKRFDFKQSPVGIKYTFKRPERLQRLDEDTTLCTMLKRAQEGRAFYADRHNFTCGGALLGMDTHAPASLSGEFAAAIKVFDSPRSASRLYPQIPEIEKDLINYVSLAPLDQLAFDPDVLIIFANDTSQTQILLRAVSYRTAEVWQSRFTPILGCAWICIYPFLSGRVNYGLTGLSHGMGRRHLFPDGLQFVAIPYHVLPAMLQALQEMPWELPSFKPDGEDFFNRTRDALLEELPKHIVY